MDKKTVIELLKKYKALLRQSFSFDKMYLFGSYANGKPDADSDIDVAIVVNELDGDYFAIRPLLWKIRRQVDDRIEPILLETQNDASGFLQEIQKNGIEIC